MCKRFSIGSVCVCRTALVSKRVRAALLHQRLVLQAYICGEINAECWWERYMASDSSHSYTQIYARTRVHTQASAHTWWVKTTLIWSGDTCGDYRVLNLLFWTYLLLCTYTNTPADANQQQIFLHPSPVFQTHDARVEWRPRFILYSRRLPGQPKTGGDRPKCGKEVGEGNKLVRKFKEKTLIRCLFVDFWSDFWCVFPPVLTDGPLGERDVVADVPGVAEV